MRIAWESDRVAPSWLVVDGKQYDGGWSMHHEVEVDGLVPGRASTFYVATAESSALPAECASVVNRRRRSSGAIEPNLDDSEFWKYLQRRDACNRLAQAIHSAPRILRATAPDAPVRIAIVGNTRADTTLPSAVLDAVAADAPDLVVHTGDVVQSGLDEQWQAFFDASAGLLSSVPLAPAPGERDLMPWGDRFSQLFGSGAGGRGAPTRSISAPCTSPCSTRRRARRASGVARARPERRRGQRRAPRARRHALGAVDARRARHGGAGVGGAGGARDTVSKRS